MVQAFERNKIIIFNNMIVMVIQKILKRWVKLNKTEGDGKVAEQTSWCKSKCI